MAEVNPRSKGPHNSDLDHNPNEGTNSGPNDAPEGPHSHLLGQTGDGGMTGKETASGKGGKFYFK